MKEKVREFFAKKGDYITNLIPKKDDALNNMSLKKSDAGQDFYEKCLEKFSTRRSVRKFSSKPVDWKIIYDIIKAAMGGPCAGDEDNYNIIVIRDRAMFNEIAKCEAGQYWIEEAPVLVAVVRNNERLLELYPEKGETYSIQNCAAFIENILMLTHMSGLGACWVEACDDGSIEKYLGVPEGSVVDAIIPIGYSLDSHDNSNRTPIEEKLYFERFGNRKL